jgi:hypothetical protein
MGRAAFGLAWSFITLAAGYDCYFAWEYRHVLSEWELNPVAMRAGLLLGIGGLIGLKFALLFFALAVAIYCRIRSRHAGQRVTQMACVIYFVLSMHYVVGQWRPVRPSVYLRTAAQSVAFGEGPRPASAGAEAGGSRD